MQHNDLLPKHQHKGVCDGDVKMLHIQIIGNGSGAKPIQNQGREHSVAHFCPYLPLKGGNCCLGDALSQGTKLS